MKSNTYSELMKIIEMQKSLIDSQMCLIRELQASKQYTQLSCPPQSNIQWVSDQPKFGSGSITIQTACDSANQCASVFPTWTEALSKAKDASEINKVLNGIY